jgi:hypothetical protein
MSAIDKLIRAREAYFQAFGEFGPQPFGIPEEDVIRVLYAAIETGRKVPESYDWYPNVIDTDDRIHLI